ncbi:unnamed protein product [Brugia pahangi]|uniref:Kinesin motor domain-containing protein n=1 Tax=Brugia pahangi TaxID=6280 RepID=A0A0N4T221_BRUPA|nr:unnamed protein product [Brugia pahangi]
MKLTVSLLTRRKIIDDKFIFGTSKIRSMMANKELMSFQSMQTKYHTVVELRPQTFCKYLSCFHFLCNVLNTKIVVVICDR